MRPIRFWSAVLALSRISPQVKRDALAYIAAPPDRRAAIECDLILAVEGARFRLSRNAVFCNTCNTKIESKHRHDFVTCRCGDVSVDGGLDYLRRCAKPNAAFEDISGWVAVSL